MSNIEWGDIGCKAQFIKGSYVAFIKNSDWEHFDGIFLIFDSFASIKSSWALYQHFFHLMQLFR